MKVYQKPTCSKCRNLLKTLKERGVEFESVDYYEQKFDTAALKKVLQKLHMRPSELMRTNENIYKEFHIAEQKLTDDELIKIMVANPDLIQRPIVIKGDKAFLARSEEGINEAIGKQL